jgi:hypothetical protein
MGRPVSKLAREDWRMKMAGVVASFMIVLFVVIGWIVIANPFNFFVQRSERFTVERFLSLRNGSSIEEAVALLGEPIFVRKSIGITCRNCTAYHFLGHPPKWLICYDEAWLLVNPQGTVVGSTLNSEP